MGMGVTTVADAFVIRLPHSTVVGVSAFAFWHFSSTPGDAVELGVAMAFFGLIYPVNFRGRSQRPDAIVGKPEGET